MLYPDEIKNTVRIGGSGTGELFKQYYYLWNETRDTLHGLWYKCLEQSDFITLDEMVIRLVDKLNKKGYRVSLFGETTLLFSFDDQGKLIHYVSSALEQKQTRDPVDNFAAKFVSLLEADGRNKEAGDRIDDPVSSPLIPEAKKDIGGIDFHALPIVTQPIINPQNNLRIIPNENIRIVSSSLAGLHRNDTVDEKTLSAEWLEIERMVNAGIIPSAERIKEYLVNSGLSEDYDNNLQKVLYCMVAILRLEEERPGFVNPEFKKIISSLESAITK